MAAIYHFKLSRAILVGFRRQLKADGICKDGFVGMLEAEPIVPLLHVALGDHILDVEIDGGVIYRDDLTGQRFSTRSWFEQLGRRRWTSSSPSRCGR